jgi:ABC-type transport system involved in cytochrome bd biosynthesis fused ATPase/permease subunit
MTRYEFFHKIALFGVSDYINIDYITVTFTILCLSTVVQILFALFERDNTLRDYHMSNSVDKLKWTYILIYTPMMILYSSVLLIIFLLSAGTIITFWIVNILLILYHVVLIAEGLETKSTFGGVASLQRMYENHIAKWSTPVHDVLYLYLTLYKIRKTQKQYLNENS